MSLNPCIPSVWPQYSVEWTVGRARYRVTVLNPDHRSQGIGSAELDGVAVDARAIPLQDDDGVHEVTIVLGAGPGESSTPAAAAGRAGQRQASP
jgi:cyclic beta-1,2-glucan synthetase